MVKQLLFLSILACTFTAQAQTLTLLLQPPPGNTLAPTDCWNVTITNPGASERVYLMGIIQDAQGQRLSEVRSAPLWLRSGVNQLDRQSVTTARTDYVNAEAQREVLGSGYLPKGVYKICVAVLRQNDDREMGLQCLDYTATNDGAADKKDRKKTQHVQFYGNAAVETVHGNQQGFRQNLPPSYTRLDANPALAVLGAPVTAQIHLTTEQNDSLPDLNTYTLRFDRATFQRNLQGMLMAKLQESFAARTKADAETLKRLKELDNLEALTKDPALLRELGVMDSLQRQLQRIEADPNLSQDEKRQKIEQVRRRMDELQAKKRQFDRLVEQKNRLLSLKQELEKSGKLRELQNRQLELPNLNDPAALRSQMKQYGLLSGMNRFLFGIDELAIGTSFPVYSPLTMNGVQVNGGHLAWNPGPIFLSATHGKTQSAWFDGSNVPGSRFEQKVTGARFGFGKVYKNHLIFTGLRFDDQIGSVVLPAGTERFPAQTTIGATAFQLSLGKKRVFELAGEVSGLLFNRNRQDSVRLKIDDVSEKIPGWLAPNLSSGADFAWNGRANVNLFGHKTRLIAGTRFVGPGFINPGTPGLRNDVLSYDGRLEQLLWRGQLRLAGGYRIESDNYSRGKGVQTLRNEVLGEVEFRLRKMPQLRVQYIKNLQENDFLTYGSDAISAYLTQQWKLGKNKRTSTHAHYLRFTNAVDSFTSAQFDAHYIYLNQMLQLGALSINGGVQQTLANIGGQAQNQTIAQAMVSSMLFKKAQLGLGVTWATSAQIDQKLGGQFTFQLPLNRYLMFDLAANLNQYTNVPGYAQAQVREQFVRGRLMVRW